MSFVASTIRALSLALLAGALLLPALPATAQDSTDDDVAYDVLAEGANEPTQIEVTPDGRIVWTERDGSIWVLTRDGIRTLAAELLPSGNLCETCAPEPDYWMPYDDPPEGPDDLAPDRPNRTGVGGLEEGGLHGLLLDDDFEETNRLYVYWSVPNTRQEVVDGLYWGDFHVSAFELDPATNLIDMASEETILTVPAEWDHCCHYGGALEYLPDGTIVLTSGDDVLASASEGYGPRDASNPWTNAELTSANPADRRGKILRFREDGSVPDGSRTGEVPNPFIGMEGYNPYIEDSPDNPYVGEAANTPGDGWIEFDPYVYSLGWKQAWRTAVMPNGDIYVSDVGPDAGVDDPERGPRGFEEVSRVPFGGGTHAGWPRCIGPNWSYIDVDWQTMETNGPLDCSDDAPIARPIGSTEPTVTGMSGAVLYYPSGPCDGSQDDSTTYDCDQWPIVGTGGKTSEPTLLYPADVEGPLALPERYRDRLFLMEWSRRFILTIPADPATGDLDLRNENMDLVTPPLYSVNPNTDEPQTSVSVMQGQLMSPIDGAIGPDGAFYFVEYGAFFFTGENGRVSRIRAADAQPDSEANYGLSTDAATPVQAGVASASSMPTLTAVVVAGIGLVLARRRRRRIVP